MICNGFIVISFAALYCVLANNASDQTDESKVLANFSFGSFLPPVSKITLPKLPSIPKRNTITLTTTVLTQKTKYVAIYPTCIKLYNIKSVCDGYLETILPTPILPTPVLWREKTESNYDSQMIGRRAITPSTVQTIRPTETIDSARINIIESSELEYEYTSPDRVTPSIDAQREKSVTGNFLESLLGPKYEIATEYLTQTKVVQYADLANQVTVIANNCVPPGVQYPLCDLDINVLKPLIDYSLKRKINKDKLMEQIRQTIEKVHQNVNKFSINNPYGFLGISPEDTRDHLYGALNSDTVPSIMRTAQLFPVARSIEDASGLDDTSESLD